MILIDQGNKFKSYVTFMITLEYYFSINISNLLINHIESKRKLLKRKFLFTILNSNSRCIEAVFQNQSWAPCRACCVVQLLDFQEMNVVDEMEEIKRKRMMMFQFDIRIAHDDDMFCAEVKNLLRSINEINIARSFEMHM